MKRIFPAWVLGLALSLAATAQVALLQIQTMEGEGTVHAPGSRSARPLVVEVTDETGRPVTGAAVSFHLPDDGPGGSFANGLQTEVVTTDARGRASLRGLQVNRTPGRFQIRIVVSKDQAHAGAVSFQYVAEPGSGAAKAAGSGARKRRIWIALAAAAGAAVGGVAATRSGGGSGGGAPAGASPPVATPSASIGSPAITVGVP